MTGLVSLEVAKDLEERGPDGVGGKHGIKRHMGGKGVMYW